MLAPRGDDATVILPVDTCVTGDAVGMRVVAVVVPGRGVVFVDRTIVVLGIGIVVVVTAGTCVVLVTGIVVVISAVTCVVTKGSKPVPVTVGTTVEFVIFWPETETGTKKNATITRIMRGIQVFFMILFSIVTISSCKPLFLTA
jgi:hypothetical protein